MLPFVVLPVPATVTVFIGNLIVWDAPAFANGRVCDGLVGSLVQLENKIETISKKLKCLSIEVIVLEKLNADQPVVIFPERLKK